MNRPRSSAPSAGRMRTAGSALLVHVAVINHFVIRGGSRAWFRHLVSPLAGFAVIGYVLYEMDSAAKMMGAVWIAHGYGVSGRADPGVEEAGDDRVVI